MALTVSLSAVTASDATFSASGATAWLTVTGRTATVAGIATAAQGGTNSAFFQVAGPSVARTYTFPDADSTIARTDAANTFTGVQTFSTPIATGSVATMSATVGGGVPTPPNNTTTFLRGDGTFAAPTASATLSGISAATGANTIASGTNSGQVWNWALTSNSVVAMTFGETTAATNGTSSSGIPNQVIAKFTTLANSTASPLSVYQRATFVFAVDPVNPQIVAGDGAFANPMYSFAADPTLGMYRVGATSVAIVANTFQALNTSGSGILWVTGTFCRLLAAGTAAIPAYSFNPNTGDGIFNPAAGSVGIASSGIENSRFSAGAWQPTKGTADAVSYALNFRKSRGTVASPTVITTGDSLATISGVGYVGATNTYLSAARLEFISTGTIADSTSGIGGIARVMTTLAGTDTALQENMRWLGGSNPITTRAAILFANLGTPANGSEAYCSDCDPPTLFNSACASSGTKTGAFAQRINGAWIC